MGERLDLQKEVYDKTGYHSQEELQALLDKYL